MALNCQVYFSFTHLAHQIERHIIIWPATSVIVVYTGTVGIGKKRFKRLCTFLISDDILINSLHGSYCMVQPISIKIQISDFLLFENQ